ncbi:MAG: beta-ketoacyl synthase [Pseudomonadota bacterium]
MADRIPLIVGFGGVNPTGRLSFHHGYRRTVLDQLPDADRRQTYQALATLMRLRGNINDPAVQQTVREGTLIRRLEAPHTDRMRWNLPVKELATIRCGISKRHLPDPLPDGWRVVDNSADPVSLEIQQNDNWFISTAQPMRVNAAGQLPRGFDPAALYASRSHPRGLQLAVFGASDALRSTGLELDVLKARVPPDQFAVFSASAMGQLDNEGLGGAFNNPLTGRRPTSKNVALGIAEMPGDFINAYVLGTAGETAGIVGACATFLYNLKRGSDAIRAGTARIALVGSSEAPVIPEIMEGYRTMGALAEDEALALLDGADQADHRRACRPFAENCGFTVSESGVYTVLMDSELAIELGARNLGAVAGVYVHADGYKKSIPGPGIGNYLTVGKALGLARAILGDDGVRTGTHIQAHGTGTPQNRTTESAIMSELAAAFGIDHWPVGAIKAFVGHSMGPAGGDQLSSVLGTFYQGILPGIPTIDALAEDVRAAHLNFAMKPLELSPEQRRGALINSKGFGGNNATSLILSPEESLKLMTQRHGTAQLNAYRDRQVRAEERAATYDSNMLDETVAPIYAFGEGVIEPRSLEISNRSIYLPGFAHPASLETSNPYED